MRSASLVDDDDEGDGLAAGFLRRLLSLFSAASSAAWAARAFSLKVMMLRTPHFENIFRRRSISATAQGKGAGGFAALGDHGDVQVRMPS